MLAVARQPADRGRELHADARDLVLVAEAEFGRDGGRGRECGSRQQQG
jgi:hypothetical protein